ncbi:MAG: hypothetical protein AABZ33_12950 [Chloroflexota bacterium]
MGAATEPMAARNPRPNAMMATADWTRGRCRCDNRGQRRLEVAVHLAGSSDHWYWSMDIELPVDFCVRALRHDGLRVSPFDQHPDGDGSLREKGLDAASWRAWFAAVLDHHSRLQGLTTTDDFSQIDRQQVSEVFDAFSTPAPRPPRAPAQERHARLDMG